MSKTLNITLPDHLEKALTQVATQAQQSPEDIVLEILSQRLQTNTFSSTSNPDPLQSLVGCITTEFTDVGENHDHYLGQSHHEDLHKD